MKRGIIMEILKYVILSVLGLTLLFIFFFAIKSRKFFKTIFLNAILGILAVAVLNLTSGFSGVYIPLNYYSAGTSAVLGLPGVLGLLVANFIFI